jgi:hypothetical protein
MTTQCLYNLKEFPATVRTVGINVENPWMGLTFTPDNVEVPVKHTFKRVPAIGDVVRITFNGLGTGTVVSYFVEHQYAGVCVRLDNDPAWHVKQCRGSRWAGCALVFGAEIETLREVPA